LNRLVYIYGRPLTEINVMASFCALKCFVISYMPKSGTERHAVELNIAEEIP